MWGSLLVEPLEGGGLLQAVWPSAAPEVCFVFGFLQLMLEGGKICVAGVAVGKFCISAAFPPFARASGRSQGALMHRADNDEILSSFGRRWAIKNHWKLVEQKPFLQRCFLSGEQSYSVPCQGWLLVAAHAVRLIVCSCIWILPELGRVIT